MEDNQYKNFESHHDKKINWADLDSQKIKSNYDSGSDSNDWDKNQYGNYGDDDFGDLDDMFDYSNNCEIEVFKINDDDTYQNATEVRFRRKIFNTYHEIEDFFASQKYTIINHETREIDHESYMFVKFACVIDNHANEETGIIDAYDDDDPNQS